MKSNTCLQQRNRCKNCRSTVFADTHYRRRNAVKSSSIVDSRQRINAVIRISRRGTTAELQGSPSTECRTWVLVLPGAIPDFGCTSIAVVLQRVVCSPFILPPHSVGTAGSSLSVPAPAFLLLAPGNTRTLRFLVSVPATSPAVLPFASHRRISDRPRTACIEGAAHPRGPADDGRGVCTH